MKKRICLVWTIGSLLAVAAPSMAWGAGERMAEVRCLVVQNGDPCVRQPVPFTLFLNDSLPGTDVLATRDFLPLFPLSGLDGPIPPFSKGRIDGSDLVEWEAFREFEALLESFPAGLREEIGAEEWFGCNAGTASPVALADARERTRARGLPLAAWDDGNLPEGGPPGFGDVFLSFVGVDGTAERAWVRNGDLACVLLPLRHGERNTRLADFWCRRHAAVEPSPSGTGTRGVRGEPTAPGTSKK
ncbi:MAG: hypothetical protein IJS32_07320 [Kiritimatiellae bacterium]|nr:hypothetical protein [Kiritimatiellia bacterium]